MRTQASRIHFFKLGPDDNSITPSLHEHVLARTKSCTLPPASHVRHWQRKMLPDPAITVQGDFEAASATATSTLKGRIQQVMKHESSVRKEFRRSSVLHITRPLAVLVQLMSQRYFWLYQRRSPDNLLYLYLPRPARHQDQWENFTASLSWHRAVDAEHYRRCTPAA